MVSRPTSALLIVGHGSTVNPDSSAPTLRHAVEIRRRGMFAEVACCFWKEEPSLRDALLFFRDETIREVYVVPNFISEGYFTRTVIPRELELTGTRNSPPKRPDLEILQAGRKPPPDDRAVAATRTRSCAGDSPKQKPASSLWDTEPA